MDGDEAYDYIAFLDETLLKGGVMLSEWCVIIIREADLAFIGGANRGGSVCLNIDRQ